MGSAIEVPTHSPQKEIDHSPCASALVERSHTLFAALDPWRPYVVEEDSACWMGHVLIADAQHDRVLRFDASAGSFVDEPLSRISGFLDRPSAFGDAQDGTFYVANFGDGSILRFSATTGEFVDRFYSNGIMMEEPVELQLRDDKIYVLGNDSENILVLSEQGNVVGELAESELHRPHDFAFGPDGYLYVAVESKGDDSTWIQVWDVSDERLVRSYGAPYRGGLAMSVTFNTLGEIFVADYAQNKIVRIDPWSGQSTVFINDDSSLVDPIAIDFGPDEHLYVLATNGLRRFNGQTGEPLGVLVEPDDLDSTMPRNFIFAR